MSPVERVVAYVASAVFIGFVLWPVFRDPKIDSFPHSTYPMFSQKKTRVVRVHQAVGKRADGSSVILPPIMVANEEVLQAAATIRRAVFGGKKRTLELCRDIADKVAKDDGEFADVVTVEIATVRYDAITYFEGDTTPGGSKVRGSCQVPGR